MSVIPSLSLWSSIKIPLSMPYADSCDKIKKENKAELDRKKTSFRVSNPLGKEKENSVPKFAFIRPDTKETFRKKKPSKVNPEAPVDCKDSEEFYRNARYKMFSRPSFEGAEEYLNFEENYCELNVGDDRVDEIYVHPIKPSTLEELYELNRKYKMMEEEVKMEAEKEKNKRKGQKAEKSEHKNEKKVSNKPNKISCLKANTSRKSLNQKFSYSSDFDEIDLYDCDLTHSESDLFSDKELILSDYSKRRSRRKTKPADKSYYETKLAELHMLELGIKD